MEQDGSDNYKNYMDDSSNFAKEGEGHFEMMQRVEKEQEPSLADKIKAIARKLMEGVI